MVKKNEKNGINELMSFLQRLIFENTLLKKENEVFNLKLATLEKQMEFTVMQQDRKILNSENLVKSLVNNVFNNEIVEEWVKFFQSNFSLDVLNKDETPTKKEEKVSIENEQHIDKSKTI